MSLVKNFKSTTKGDVPIAVIEKHQYIANQFFVEAFSCMQKPLTPVHPDKTYWSNLSFILNYKKDALCFGGYGRFLPYVSVALFDCISNDDQKEYLIEVPTIFTKDRKVKSFTGPVQTYIANLCAIHLADTIRKYLQNNFVAHQNPMININKYERADLLAPSGIVFKDIYKFLYLNVLVGELQELDSLALTTAS
jgi:hypothetical protein